jgi:hypothetical protein
MESRSAITAESVAESVERDGYAIAPSVADRALIERLREACPPIPSAGVRDLLSAAPVFRTLADHPTVRRLASSVLGRPAFVTRAILFDKAPGANWALGFHQDVTIAVASASRLPATGRGPSRRASRTSARPRRCSSG